MNPRDFSFSQRLICTAMFTTLLFTIVKMEKQTKFPSTDIWIKKIWYVHTLEHYSVLKKEGNSAICDNIGEPGEHYVK